MAIGNTYIDFSVFHNRLRVRGTLSAETALRIGSGGSSGPTEHDLPVLKDVYGRPYIPGSSFKGAYRAHLERLLRAMDETLACTSTSRPRQAGALPGCLTQGDIDRLKQDYQDKPAKLTAEILRRSCWTCSVLGAPWLASKVLVRDLTVVPETWFDHYLIRDGVAIDRDTETAAEGLKYDFEAVPSGVGFRFEMVIENASDAELGLALLGLREFEMGNVALGGAISRGLGSVTLALDWAQSEWLTAPNLRAYFAEQSVERLQEESQRAQYWTAFLAALDKGKEV
ncbi:MAG: CRISPR-associated RAMP protein [Anaerolineae bacterium]|nr:CRISPR-associated RAMP protein [Anaerolineae bacterium]